MKTAWNLPIPDTSVLRTSFIYWFLTFFSSLERIQLLEADCTSFAKKGICAISGFFKINMNTL